MFISTYVHVRTAWHKKTSPRFVPNKLKVNEKFVRKNKAITTDTS